MKRGNITMRAWLAKATPDEKKILAAAAKTSVRHLAHIAAGRRQIGAELAQRLAAVSDFDPRNLCPTCARCPLAK